MVTKALRRTLWTLSRVVLCGAAGLCLVGCGAWQVMDRKTSPDGKTEAVIVGISGRVDYRNVELRDTHAASLKLVVFKSQDTRITTRWLRDDELAIYYSEGGTLIWATPKNYFQGHRYVLVRLRPVTGEEEQSLPLR